MQRELEGFDLLLNWVKWFYSCCCKSRNDSSNDFKANLYLFLYYASKLLLFVLIVESSTLHFGYCHPMQQLHVNRILVKENHLVKFFNQFQSLIVIFSRKVDKFQHHLDQVYQHLVQIEFNYSHKRNYITGKFTNYLIIGLILNTLSIESYFIFIIFNFNLVKYTLWFTIFY